MQCEECQKRPATVHFTQIVNGEKTEVHVCDVCAQKLQHNYPAVDSFSLHDILVGLFNVNAPQMNVKNNTLFDPFKELECDSCHMSFADFQRIGKFGCSKCYHSFKGKIEPIFRRVHSGNVKHTGKIPHRKGGHLHIKKEIETYRNYLNELIAQENFEEAAIVRDRIKELEKKQGGEP